MLLIVCFGFCGGGGCGCGGIARPNYGWQAVGNQIFLARAGLAFLRPVFFSVRPFFLSG